MKGNIIYIAIIVLVFLFPEISEASRMAEKICDIRSLFCINSVMGSVLVAFSLVFVGILSFNGRMHWTLVFLIVVGIMIFINAHDVTEDISTDEDFEVDDGCKCT